VIKVAWLLMTAVFTPQNHLLISELHYLDSREQCERYGQDQLAEWRAHGVPLESMNYACIQVVVPE
jgi:hypothetical protein